MAGRSLLLATTFLFISACSGMSEAERAHDTGLELALDGRHQEAIAEFDRAIELDPGLAEAYGARGFSYGQLENYDKAFDDTNKAVELAPDKAIGYYQRALITGINGDVDAALADLDKAAELDPEDPDIFMSRAAIHIYRGNCEASIDDFTRGFGTSNTDTKLKVATQLAESCPDWLEQSPTDSN
jgi:tetratricopeptide (TPR) repeat protein